MNTHKLDQKVVAITGGASGIGKAMALEAAARGAFISICDISQESIDSTLAILEKAGVKATGILADITKESDCQKFVEHTVKTLGKLDVLINNAGITARGRINDTQTATIEKVMAVNFNGAVYCTKAAVGQIIANKGSIVAISSIAGKRGLPERSAYSASKFAMQGFFESLRTEMSDHDVNVLVVNPGFTNTSIHSKGQGEFYKQDTRKNFATPEEVATQVMDAIEARKRDLLLTFNGKLTVFLNHFFPRFTDRILKKYIAKM